MNSAFFLALFFLACIVCTNAFGTLTTVAYNGALTIPLLSATTGTIGLPLAVLGALKLGAAALLLASLGGQSEESGYGQRKRFTRDVVNGVSTDKDALFALIRSMDQLECGKSLICELEAKDEAEILEDEALILSLFR